MDEAIKDLIKQDIRARGLTLPAPAKAIQAMLWTQARVARACETLGYPPSSSTLELEEKMADLIKMLLTLAIVYDLSPIEYLVRRLNRRITDA